MPHTIKEALFVFKKALSSIKRGKGRKIKRFAGAHMYVYI